MTKKIWIGLLWTGLFAAPGMSFAHCEIPCGIYDDNAKIEEMKQHVLTIEKSVREIAALEAAEKPDLNQLVRWINNKDAHADKLKEAVAFYFLSQRVKFPETEEDRGAYSRQLELLHQISVYAMKTKQTVDPETVALLRGALNDFQTLYSDLHAAQHE